MKRAALHNLGCKVNAYETEAMQQLLEEAGYEIVAFHEKADVYIVNTCSVTNIADRKSRQMLHRARKMNPQAVIVAAGCYVQASAEDIRKEGIADIILGNNKKKHLVSMLEAYSKGAGPATDWEDINDGAKEYERLSVARMAGHTRAFIKIQDGCNQFCSYCIIPYARGRVRSRQPEDVVREVRRLAEGGCKEVVLTGIHLSSYGSDFGGTATGFLSKDAGDGQNLKWPGYTGNATGFMCAGIRSGQNSYGTDVASNASPPLLKLLGQMQEIPGICRIRLGSLEPGIVTEEFAEALAGMGKICPHFHLSLQSGCDSVLKRMNRKYDTADYAKRCGILREYFKDPAITTDVIVGFPGETEEEFRDTELFLEKIHFYELHVFKYSKRKGTKAAAMDGQVPEEVKAQRSARLIALGEAMSREYRESRVGQEVSVLMEEPFSYGGKKYYTGYTPEYVKVAIETDENRANCIVEGKIFGYLARDIYLMVEF